MAGALNKLRHSSWLNIVAFFTFLGLTLLMTWPLITHLRSEIAGAGTDVWIHQWTFWWVKQALLNGQSPFYTTLLYYPYGVSLTSHNIAWFNIALWLPLQAVLGSVTAYNIVFLLVITLNGFAAYLFAKAEIGAVLPAFVAGVMVSFWPYTFSHFDHPNMMVTFWVPLTMYFMLSIFRSGRPRDTLFFAISLAMVGITRWQLLVLSAPLMLAYGLYLVYREREARSRKTAVLLLSSMALSVLLMAPLAAPLVLDQLGRSGPEAVAYEEPDDGVTDLFAYIAPPDLYRAIWNEIPEQLPYPEWEPYHRISASAHYVPFIGLATLALALYGLLRRWSQTWFWLLVALGTILLALGPELAINGRRFASVPMPYRLVSDTLLDALIRRPHRFNNFLGLPVAMMASWGTADLLSRIRRRWSNGRGDSYAFLATLLLCGIILLENPIPPLPTTDPGVPQWYQDLATNEEGFAILELPFHSRGFDKLYMYYQTVHGKPILVGHVSRLPQEAFTFLDTIPFLEPLKSIYTWNVVDESWVDFADKDVTREFALLAAQNVRYVVINKPLIAEGFVERWRDWVSFEPDYEDDQVLVYTTAPRAGEQFEINFPLADGIGLIEATVAPREGIQGGVIKVNLRWGSDAPPASDYLVCFTVVNEGGSLAAELCEEPVSGWPTSEWGANAVARGSYLIPLDSDLAPGTYSMEIALVDAGSLEPLGSPFHAGNITVAAYDPQESVNSCWEGDLCLRGYDASTDTQTLNLALYWQAGAPAAESYKRYVHLVDSQDGRVVAQDDAIPRGWTYPTDIWEPAEIVADRVSLPLDGLAPGSYELRVGWYAVDGGQALPACQDDSCTGDYHVLSSVAVP